MDKRKRQNRETDKIGSFAVLAYFFAMLIAEEGGAHYGV